MNNEYPSDVKTIVHVELVNGETRDYGISADNPSILGYLGRKGKEEGFVHLWNKQEAHMINYESIRSMRATRYVREEENTSTQQEKPKSRARKWPKHDPKQESLPM